MAAVVGLGAPLAATFRRTAAGGHRVRSTRCHRVVARASAAGEGLDGKKKAALAAIAVRVQRCLHAKRIYPHFRWALFFSFFFFGSPPLLAALVTSSA